LDTRLAAWVLLGEMVKLDFDAWADAVPESRLSLPDRLSVDFETRMDSEVDGDPWLWDRDRLGVDMECARSAPFVALAEGVVDAVLESSLAV